MPGAIVPFNGDARLLHIALMAAVSQRALNRTLLERQFLSTRTDVPSLDVIRRLVALQAQEPNAPYIGLWTRIDGFRHAQLTALLDERAAVRATTIRATQHILAGRDYRWLRPLVQRVLDRGPRQGALTGALCWRKRRSSVTSWPATARPGTSWSQPELPRYGAHARTPRRHRENDTKC